MSVPVPVSVPVSVSLPVPVPMPVPVLVPVPGLPRLTAPLLFCVLQVSGYAGLGAPGAADVLRPAVLGHARGPRPLHLRRPARSGGATDRGQFTTHRLT